MLPEMISRGWTGTSWGGRLHRLATRVATVEESIKRTVQSYVVFEGNVCAFAATKDHVNVFLYDPTVSDPEGVINQGHGDTTARAIEM